MIISKKVYLVIRELKMKDYCVFFDELGFYEIIAKGFGLVQNL